MNYFLWFCAAIGFLGVGVYTLVSSYYLFVESSGKLKSKEDFMKTIPQRWQRIGAISMALFGFGLVGLVIMRM